MRCASPIWVAEGLAEAACGTPVSFTGPDGTRLSARLAGPEDAPPIVLVHGFSMSSLSFSRQLGGPLAQRFRLIAPDLRGHGMSQQGADLTALGEGRTWAGDLQAAVGAFTRTPPLLVGWSYGGRVLCAHFAHGGEAVGAMFVSSVTDDVLPDGKPPHGPAASLLPAMLEADDAVAIAATIAFVDAMTAAPLPPPDRDRLIATASAVPRLVRQNMRALRSDNHALLQSLALPVLALHGQEDRVIRPAAAMAIADTAPNGSRVLLDGVGHAPFLEDAPRFDAEVERFARQCGLA